MAVRAKQRLIEAQAAYQEKLAARQAKEQSTGKKPPDKSPPNRQKVSALFDNSPHGFFDRGSRHFSKLS